MKCCRCSSFNTSPRPKSSTLRYLSISRKGIKVGIRNRKAVKGDEGQRESRDGKLQKRMVSGLFMKRERKRERKWILYNTVMTAAQPTPSEEVSRYVSAPPISSTSF